jgi:hypothetical protein
MIFVTKDGTVTSEENIRAMNPLVSFPSPLKAGDVEPFGYQVVQEVAAPTSSPFVRVESGALALIDGVWTQTWNQIPAAVTDAQTQLLGALANARYEAQIVPVTINGVTVNADSASLTMLKSAIDYLNGSTTAMVNFKAVSGWTTLSLAQLQELAEAINAQIQTCFTNEYAHTQKIMKLDTIDTISAYDITTGW